MRELDKIRAELERGAVLFAASEVSALVREVADLEEDSRFLAALHAAGVDNWEGYSAGFDDEDDED